MLQIRSVRLVCNGCKLSKTAGIVLSVELGVRIEAIMNKLFSRVRSPLSDRSTATLPDSTRYVMLKIGCLDQACPDTDRPDLYYVPRLGREHVGSGTTAQVYRYA